MTKILHMVLQRMLFCQVSEFFLHNVSVIVATRPFGDCSIRELCCGFNATRDIRYLLYNQNYPNGDGIRLPVNNVNQLLEIYNTRNIDKTLETIFFVHGFTEGAPGISGNTIRDAFLQRGNYNIILVDWRNLVAGPWYTSAAQNTKQLGKNMAILIQGLEKIGVPISKIHLIGFSLGAEAVGFTGKILRDSNGNPRLHHITGLDPAWPLFPLRNQPNGKLDKSDAKFVDVIHTDAGVFGYPISMGDVDFYPNTGRHYQPGCNPKYFDSRNNQQIGLFLSCSHVRAWKYYAESVVNPYGFKATKCSINYLNQLQPLKCDYKDVAYMGFAVNQSVRGNYYLNTNGYPPYAIPTANNTIEKLQRI